MFTHSVRLVINNLDVALRVSLLLYLVQIASQLFSHSVGVEMVAGPDGGVYPVHSGIEGLVMMALGIAALCASLWIAVAWHRFVLLGETPSGWLPKWPGGTVLGYLWRSILLGLAVGVALLPVIMLTSIMLPPIAMMSIVVGAGAYLFFRLSPILPAIALGETMSFKDAWVATRDASGTMAGLAGLMILATFVMQIPTMLSGDPNSTLSLVYSIVVGWFATMIGISLLTTVYGHCVEGRGVD
ncbi:MULTISPECIES: hypothetical protein [unclassified Marinovum]